MAAVKNKGKLIFLKVNVINNPRWYMKRGIFLKFCIAGKIISAGGYVIIMLSRTSDQSVCLKIAYPQPGECF
jgi:hypothetical protein